MKRNNIQNEGIGDSLKNAASAGLGMAGRFADATSTAFGTAIGMDASRPSALKTQQNLAKNNFVGKFVAKMQGFISSTEEAIKDDIVLLQKQKAIQQAQQQAQQQGQPVPSPGQIVVPQTYRTRTSESVDFEKMFKKFLKEDQISDDYTQQYASRIEQAITSYMSGNVGNLGSQIKNASMQIAQSVLSNKDYSQVLKKLGEQIFDSYYSEQRGQYVRSKPASNLPLSPAAQQVLALMKKLEPEEQDNVIQKLKQHTF
jgi:hypothetical protein